jgi:predicted Zn-dependent protease with MMP-like domain
MGEERVDDRVYGRLVKAAEEEIRALVRALPVELRAKVQAIPIQCLPRPTRAQVKSGVDPDLMGLFEGQSLAEETTDPLPPTVFLFLENIYEEAERDPEIYREEVRRTLLHEVGHYLGLDEDDLFDRDVD